jgi:hypothetical protein
MKKLGFVVAALGALVVALPSIASAETIVVKRGGHHWHNGWGARAEMRHDRGWHRGWDRHHHDRVVIVKRHHRDY